MAPFAIVPVALLELLPAEIARLITQTTYLSEPASHALTLLKLARLLYARRSVQCSLDAGSLQSRGTVGRVDVGGIGK